MLYNLETTSVALLELSLLHLTANREEKENMCFERCEGIHIRRMINKGNTSSTE